MKFTDLTSNSRSMLAALCATSGTGLDTSALARCVTPGKMDCASAASVLLDMRKKGLVYSNQKPQGQSYALWKASEYGLAVFMGRPDTDVQPAAVNGQAEAPATQASKSYMLLDTAGSGDFVQGIRDKALAEAQRRATAKPGTEYKVYELIASAHMPVPQAQITLL